MDSSPNLYEPSHTSQQNTATYHLGLSLSSPSKVNSPSAKQRDLSTLRAGDLSAAVAELAADLNTPEISFDLQQFISTEIAASANAAPGSLPVLEGSVSLFTDFLEGKRAQAQQVPTSSAEARSHEFNNFPMTQQSREGTERYGAEANLPLAHIKREPMDTEKLDYSSCTQNSSAPFSGFNSARHGPNTNYRTLSESQTGPMSLMHFPNANTNSNLSACSPASTLSGSDMKNIKSSKKNSTKGSDEYKKRRERNNIAVRKSREKAKQRSRETEKRVCELQRDNESLRKRVDMLGNQLSVLKNLLTNVGVSSESIEIEITRSLQMDGHRR